MVLQSSVPEWLRTALEKQGGVTAYRVRFSGARPIYSISSEVEHVTFNHGVLGALPKWSTIYPISSMERVPDYESVDKRSTRLWDIRYARLVQRIERGASNANMKFRLLHRVPDMQP